MYIKPTSSGIYGQEVIELITRDTMTVISNLTPGTYYTLSVTANNAVSSQINATSSTSTIKIATLSQGEPYHS